MDYISQLNQLKDYSLWGNTAYDYILALAIFIGALIVIKVFQVIILARLKHLAKKTKTDFDDVLIDIFRGIRPPFYFLISLYLGIKSLFVTEFAERIVYILFLVVAIYEIIQALSLMIDYLLQKYLARMDDGKTVKGSKSMAKASGIIFKVILWAFGIVLVLGNLGIDVSSMIAGLGIGGIAIALALQNILGDIFSSFSIYIDQPFKIGDFIQAGTESGVVEKIGLKSTRIRTLQGEELVISNQELVGARVQNFKKMEKRRVVFNLGIVYGTPAEKIEKIPIVVKEIVDKTKKVDFDRCHFKTYGDFSLNFEVVYYVNSPDYMEYMDLNQKVNLEIYKRFEKEKIEFAYPTQTIKLEK